MSGDARYQVFVSSTYTDLVAERQIVMSALLQLGALPAGMELFPAANDEAWVLVKRVIDESDYYLLVIGGRYGSVNAEGLSYTEREYDYATTQEKPVMAFLHANPEKIPLKDSEGDPAARDKLDAFRKRVEGSKHVKFWTSAEDLAGKIALSFASFTRNYPSAGWVRGDAGDSPETLRKLAKAQDRIVDLEARLQARSAGPPPSAEGLADAEERLEFTVSAEVTLRNVPYTSGIETAHTFSIDLSMSWNEILSSLGPAMLDEARQQDLADRFVSAVTRINRERIRQQVSTLLLEKIPPPKHDDLRKGRFSTQLPDLKDEFETVLLQFDALGLMERGVKKRPISDQSIYWKLSEWGRTRLKRLRAVRSGYNKPPDLDSLVITDDGKTTSTTSGLDAATAPASGGPSVGSPSS